MVLRSWSTTFTGLALIALMGCGQSQPDGRATDAEPSSPEAQAPAATPGGGPADASTRTVFPGLFSIMTELERNLADVSRGFWLEDFEVIAVAARSVAGHPTVPPEELEWISEALGPDLARFKAWDVQLHDLAVRMSEAAAAGEIPSLLEMDAELRAGCVGCHSEFRERLREASR